MPWTFFVHGIFFRFSGSYGVARRFQSRKKYGILKFGKNVFCYRMPYSKGRKCVWKKEKLLASVELEFSRKTQ